jgi:MYXO-CTERM domain-containing protein
MLLGTNAIVTLPGATGAQGDLGYYALVTAAGADGRETGSVAKVVHAEPGTTVEVLMIDDPEKDYQPCFTVEVRDLSGQTVNVEPVCLDELVPQTRALDGDAGADPEEVDGGLGFPDDAGPNDKDASPQVTGETEGPPATGNDRDAATLGPDSDDGEATTADNATSGDAPVATNDDAGGCSVATSRAPTSWSSLGLLGIAFGVATLRRRRH